MPRKIESWTEFAIKDTSDLAHALLRYSEREIVIITCSMIDSLLADLLAANLRNNEKEIEAFLGLDANGRAPLGSFGSRIQAAYLFELIDDTDLKICRILKDIRNRFAHRVVVSFEDVVIVKKIRTLTELVRDRGPREVRPDREYATKEEFSKSLAELKYSKDACTGFYAAAAASQINHLHQICNNKKGETSPTAKKKGKRK